ncbi:MAG: ubiquinol-cytochrome c reductase iron-sulfur subunit N-terminal domain-containing protein [Jatrophihabitantaceae bacterium]
MTEHSRRKFLTHASLGAAAVGAAAVAPALTASAAAEPLAAGPVHHGPFLAWVKDAKSGEISVLVGETEVVHHDRLLAARLAQIAGRAQ